MITAALLNFFHAIVSGMWSLVPPWSITVPQELLSLLTTSAQWNWIAPVTEVGVCLGLGVTLFGALMALKAFKLVVSWIPGIGGGG
jgi:hypothetical protein